MIPPLEINAPLEAISTPSVFSINISCVRWCPLSNEAQQTSSISCCSHKEGSKILTLRVIVIRRRSLPSSPSVGIYYPHLVMSVLFRVYEVQAYLVLSHNIFYFVMRMIGC